MPKNKRNRQKPGGISEDKFLAYEKQKRLSRAQNLAENVGCTVDEVIWQEDSRDRLKKAKQDIKNKQTPEHIKETIRRKEAAAKKRKEEGRSLPPIIQTVVSGGSASKK